MVLLLASSDSRQCTRAAPQRAETGLEANPKWRGGRYSILSDARAQRGQGTHPNVNSPDFDNPSSKPTRWLLAWGSLVLAAAESICVAAVGLSGVRVALGLTSLLAAGASGPAQGLHREAIRIPLLTVGAIGALISLLLLWNEDRLRRNPAAAWRMQPLTPKQRRLRWLQLGLAILTLLLVAAELITHPWFHREF